MSAFPPAARKLAAEAGIDPAAVDGTGRAGRVTKEDVQRAIELEAEAEAEPVPAPAATLADEPVSAEDDEGRVERRVPMTPPARHHRPATGGGAADRGHAHHLQRGGHGAGDDDAQSLRRGVSGAPQRHPTRLHVLLRARLRRGAEAVPVRERLHRRQRHRLSRLLRHRRRREHRSRPRGAGDPRRRRPCHAPDRRRHHRVRRARPRRSPRHRRRERRHLHHLQRRACSARSSPPRS